MTSHKNHHESVEGCRHCETREIAPSDPRPQFSIHEKPALEINGVDVLGELTAGVKLADLVHRTGTKRGKLRRLIQVALGGKESYQETREEIVKATKRNKGDANHSTIDQGVPTIPSTRIEDGWTLGTIFVNYGGAKLKGVDEYDPRISESLIISPDGQRYVIAKSNERADLLVVEGPALLTLPPIRLRKFETSSVFRLVRDHEELVERGQKANEARRAAKRVKRKK